MTIHIIWDWNGTILDDLDISITILNEMLESRKKPLITKEVYLDVFIFPIKKYYDIVGLRMDNLEYEKTAVEYMKRYKTKLPEAKLHDDILEVVSNFHALGVTQIIISASERSFLIEQVKSFGIHKYFDGIYGLGDYLGYSKADIAKDWLSSSGVDPGSILMVGDTLHDFEVSCELGGKCVLIAAGHQSKERLLTCGAEVLDRADEITKHIITI